MRPFILFIFFQNTVILRPRAAATKRKTNAIEIDFMVCKKKDKNYPFSAPIRRSIPPL
jgi:hypothetical protein